MKRNKLILSAALLLLAFSLLFTGCSVDASYIGTLENEQIPVSDYNLNMFSAIAAAQSKTGETTIDLDAILSHEIDGQPADEWISDYALRQLRDMLAVEKEFERLGLVLSDEDIAAAEAEAAKQWETYSENYTMNGVNMESLRRSTLATYMPQMIFEALYAADGDLALSDEEIVLFFEEYLFFRAIGIRKFDAEGETLTEDELEEQLAKAEEYRQRLMDGEDGDALVAQSEEEYCEEMETELDHEHGSPLVPHITVSEKGDLFYSVALSEFIEGMAVGEVAVYEEDEDYYFVIQKLTAADHPTLVEDNRFAVSYELCMENFSAYMESLADKLTIVVNEDALKVYNARSFSLK